MMSKTKRNLLLISIFLLISAAAYSQVASSDSMVDPQCLSDDENFARFYDFLAFVGAMLGFLILPALAPILDAVRNRWSWADPSTRWRRFGVAVSAVFLILVFLPPQLARVSPFFRPFGLTFFHSIGNIRLEYLACNVQSVPRDYGLFFFLRWSPGPDLIISYWWAQLVVFFVYAAIASTCYFLVSAAIAKRRLEGMAE